MTFSEINLWTKSHVTPPKLLGETITTGKSFFNLFFIDICCYCLSRLVEQDSNAQEVVSKMPQLINKLLFMIHCTCRGCPSECAQYPLFSRQLAAIILFYCTFNVKCAQSFVDCGALAKMVQITTNLFVNKEKYDTPLR